jgi:hypothetical protein
MEQQGVRHLAIRTHATTSRRWSWLFASEVMRVAVVAIMLVVVGEARLAYPEPRPTADTLQYLAAAQQQSAERESLHRSRAVASPCPLNECSNLNAIQPGTEALFDGDLGTFYTAPNRGNVSLPINPANPIVMLWIVPRRVDNQPFQCTFYYFYQSVQYVCYNNQPVVLNLGSYIGALDLIVLFEKDAVPQRASIYEIRAYNSFEYSSPTIDISLATTTQPGCFALAAAPVTDNCEIPFPPVPAVIAQQNCTPVIEWFARDGSNNLQSATWQVDPGIQVLPPVLTGGGGVKNLECDVSLVPMKGKTATLIPNAVADACTNAPVVINYTDTLESISNGYLPTYLRVWTAINACGFVTTLEELLVLSDSKGPEVHISDTSVPCTDSVLPSTTGTPTLVDCDPNASILNYNDLRIDLMTCQAFSAVIERTWFASDTAGRPGSATQTIALVRLPPVWASFPLDVSFECGSTYSTTLAALGTPSANVVCPPLGMPTSVSISNVDSGQTSCGGTSQVRTTASLVHRIVGTNTDCLYMYIVLVCVCVCVCVCVVCVCVSRFNEFGPPLILVD